MGGVQTTLLKGGTGSLHAKEVSIKKSDLFGNRFFFSSGDRTRTCDLWVMSPTSYQLLHPAILSRGVQKIENPC